MAIIESSITLNFPDQNFFRFEDCDGYRKINGHFKEMDACWYEQTTDTLFIFELKDWGSGRLQEENNPTISPQEIAERKKGITDYRIRELVKKSIDSSCMFMSMLLGKPYSSNIQRCAPFTISNSTSIKLITIINWTNPDPTYISSLNTEYRSRFKSYATLFDVKAFLVMTKTQASRQFDWIS